MGVNIEHISGGDGKLEQNYNKFYRKLEKLVRVFYHSLK